MPYWITKAVHEYKKGPMKIGFACGVFDLFHAGHVLMLEECKEHCDFLIVGLNSANEFDIGINPGKKRPIYNLEHRKLIIESCKYVDKVIVYNNEKELEVVLRNEKIDIRFLGEDYRNRPITAPEAVNEIYYTNRDHGLSTSLYRTMIENKISE
jgi:glycerol-3-phosphate cytidylyltransferase